MADQIGIEISGVCSFLFFPTSNDPQERKQGLELAGKMTQAAQPRHGKSVGDPRRIHMPWRRCITRDICLARASRIPWATLPL